MKKILGLAALCVVPIALSACSGAQTASVQIDGCVVSPASFHDGVVQFSVRNDTTRPAAFQVTENKDEAVGQVMVGARATRTLTVHLDEDDSYRVMCGMTAGPALKVSR